MDVIDVSEKLMAEFEHRLGLEVVSRTVLQCRQDLCTSPVSALPELVERSARQRLIDLVGAPLPAPRAARG